METKKGTHSAEFMLKEYERVSGLWVDENHQAEQRVNFFLTITSAGTGAIVLLFQSSTLPVEVVYSLAIGILVILLIFGITFLNRLSARRVQVRAFRQSLTEIQDYFAEKDPEIASYLKRQRNIYRDREYRFKFLFVILDKLTGGLTAIVVLANSLMCGGITLLVLSRSGYAIQPIVLWTVVVTVLSILLLYFYSLILRNNLPVWKYY